MASGLLPQPHSFSKLVAPAHAVIASTRVVELLVAIVDQYYSNELPLHKKT